MVPADSQFVRYCLHNCIAQRLSWLYVLRDLLWQRRIGAPQNSMDGAHAVITSDQLATVAIRRVIFHDVPRKTHGQEPTLSEIETDVDNVRKGHLRTKLTRVLGSKSAYPVQFNPNSSSPVPSQVRFLTEAHQSSAKFVAASQQMAKYLFEQHTGAVSPGLLCVIDVAIGGAKNATVLMKLEREEGAQLELTNSHGKKTFAMSVLDNLVLTDGTRLFKTAMFVRVGTGEDDFESAACDNQLSVMSSDDLAKFWMRFLGCMFVEDPRVATHRFFESAVRFVNEVVTDPVTKADVYDHLQSQLKASKKMFSPKAFIEEYVPDEYQKQFRDHLQSEKVSLNAFTKDLADIQSALRRRAYQTTKGAMISVPAEQTDLVVVAKDKITVNDSLVKMK